MQTQPDEIISELICELMKFQVAKSEDTEEYEANYFRARLLDRFVRKDCALQHLANENAPYVNGWCSYALACLNIEGENCRSRETLGHFHAVAIDAALLSTGAGSSCELDRVRDLKKVLFNELKSRGLGRTEIERASPAIRDQLYVRGSLMAAICADAHSRHKITRNIIKGIATSVSERVGEAESGNSKAIASETVARRTQTAWYRFSGRPCLIVGHCSIPAGAVTGSLLCIWMLGSDREGWMESPFMVALLMVAALSPAAFLVMHYRRPRLEKWCEKVPGGTWIHLTLTLLILPGGIVSFMGACFLLLGAAGLSLFLLVALVELFKKSLVS